MSPVTHETYADVLGFLQAQFRGDDDGARHIFLQYRTPEQQTDFFLSLVAAAMATARIAGLAMGVDPGKILAQAAIDVREAGASA